MENKISIVTINLVLPQGHGQDYVINVIFVHMQIESLNLHLAN